MIKVVYSTSHNVGVNAYNKLEQRHGGIAHVPSHQSDKVSHVVRGEPAVFPG